MIKEGKYYRLKDLEGFKRVNKDLSGSPYYGIDSLDIKQLCKKPHKCITLIEPARPMDRKVAIIFDGLIQWNFLKDTLPFFEEVKEFIQEEFDI